MDLKEKVTKALFQSLKPEYLRLEDEDGISGYVVSRQFKGMSSLDRQGEIEKTLQNAPLAREERRRILMIAGLTPEEYEAVGPRIRIHEVNDMAGGAVEILLHGGVSDAQYVRELLQNQKGVQTSDPKPVTGTNDQLVSVHAKGTKANPLTKAKTIQLLTMDQYIEVMSNA